MSDCALCGKPNAPHYSPIGIYSGSPNGEWLCAEGNSHGVSSREAWACYYRYQQKSKETKQ